MKGQPISHTERSRIVDVARHEMGHYIVGRALGFEMGDCTIVVSFPDGHRGGAVISLSTPTATFEEAVDYLERRVQVLYAGALAQALQNGDVSKEISEAVLTKDADQDHAKIRELINAIRNMKYANTPSVEWQGQLRQIENDLVDKTYNLIVADAELIIGLSERLADEVKKYEIVGTLTAADFAAIPNFKRRFP